MAWVRNSGDLSVKRRGEGGTQPFDIDMIPEIKKECIKKR